MCAHTQTSLPRDWGRRTVQPCGIQPLSLSLRTGEFVPCTRTYVKLLGPCFKTGERKPFRQMNKLGPPHRKAASGRPNPAWQTLITAPRIASNGGSMTSLDTGFLCFRFSNFRYSLTLFSKSFASFPHGTCALSVSHQYLALDGIYHPLRAAIPNNSTLRRGLAGQANGSITLSAVLFQGTWSGATIAHVHRSQLNTQRGADSHCELIPLQSPLLGESWLVSFPPLNYMLKFGGSSCLSGDQMEGIQQTMLLVASKWLVSSFVRSFVRSSVQPFIGATINPNK
jgi:hypothetical protein